MMKSFGLVLILLMGAGAINSADSCDFQAAANAIVAAKKMGSFDDQSDRLTVKWGNDWSYLNRDQKFSLINTVANADACLMGKARPIYFYFYNKLVGQADPTWGIKQTD
jgi:hypothetical protein